MAKRYETPLQAFEAAKRLWGYIAKEGVYKHKAAEMCGMAYDLHDCPCCEYVATSLAQRVTNTTAQHVQSQNGLLRTLHLRVKNKVPHPWHGV